MAPNSTLGDDREDDDNIAARARPFPPASRTLGATSLRGSLPLDLRPVDGGVSLRPAIVFAPVHLLRTEPLLQRSPQQLDAQNAPVSVESNVKAGVMRMTSALTAASNGTPPRRIHRPRREHS